MTDHLKQREESRSEGTPEGVPSLALLALAGHAGAAPQSPPPNEVEPEVPTVQALSVSVSRYYALEQRAVASLVAGCDRHLALARAVQRTVDLSMPAKSVATGKGNGHRHSAKPISPEQAEIDTLKAKLRRVHADLELAQVQIRLARIHPGLVDSQPAVDDPASKKTSDVLASNASTGEPNADAARPSNNLTVKMSLNKSNSPTLPPCRRGPACQQPRRQAEHQARHVILDFRNRAARLGITSPDAARRLGIAPRTLRYLVALGLPRRKTLVG